MKNKQLVKITEGAIIIALAIGLSYLKIPVGFAWGGFGGSIDLVMIPLIVYAIRRGGLWGMGAGLIFGTLKFFLAEGFAVNWQSMLLDYSLAYMMVGIGGFVHKAKYSVPFSAVAALLGCIGRFAVHFISGVTIYAEYMPEKFFDITMTSPALYSMLYNGSYMIPNSIIAVIACTLISVPINKALEKR